MPSPKYTKIEITPEAYLALEAESILHSKTLKKLASEFILRGVSKEALDFAKSALASIEKNTKLNSEKMSKVIKDIGTTAVRIDEEILVTIRKKLCEKGYMDAMLYIVQHTASIQRDELSRVLTISQYYKLLPVEAAEIIKHLNNIESENKL
jgi:DNA-directed RNA polymerase subunit F